MKNYKHGTINWDENGDFVYGMHDKFGKAEIRMLKGQHKSGEFFAYERIFFEKMQDEEGISEMNIEGYFTRDEN